MLRFVVRPLGQMIDTATDSALPIPKCVSVELIDRKLDEPRISFI